MERPFVVDPVLVGVAIAYKNARMIADEVLPRIPTAEKFKYLEYPIGEAFNAPDNRVGRKSKPNEVSFTATQKDSSTEDFGLDDSIPLSDITNAPPGVDPKMHAVQLLENYNQLAREQRVASMAFNPANFGANTTPLSGASQWNDPTSDPLSYLLKLFDGMLMRPTHAAIGRSVFTQLRLHPKIVKASNGNSGDSGAASRAVIAELLELEDIFIGDGLVNVAKPGQPASIQRAWGKHAMFYHRDLTANTRGGITFGFTAQSGTKVAGTIADPYIGLYGGERVRNGESVRELIVAPDLGYLVTNAVA